MPRRFVSKGPNLAPWARQVPNTMVFEDIDCNGEPRWSGISCFAAPTFNVFDIERGCYPPDLGAFLAFEV